MTRRLDPKWAARRQKLQMRFEELHPIRDASHFAYMRGPQTTFTEAEVREMWSAAVPSPVSDREARNHVYVHVPYVHSSGN